MEIVKIVPNILDIYSPWVVFLHPVERQLINLDIKFALLPGPYGLLKERSSAACNGVFVPGEVKWFYITVET